MSRQTGRARPPDATNDPMLLVATNLRRLRVAMDLSQEELAERAGLDRTFVCMCERSRRNVTVGSLFALARGLQCDPAELLRLSPDVRFRRWWP